MINVTMIPIADIAVGDRVREKLGDLIELGQSITANDGLIQPIVVTRSHELVCGERRLAALRELEWTQAPIVYLDSESGAAQALAERDENTCRMPFSPVEASRARDRVRAAFAEAGKQRQREHGGTAPGRPNSSANLAEVNDRPAQETRKLSAAGTGYSGSTLDKVDQIRSAAERGVVKQGKTEREVPDEVREIAKQGLSDVSETGAAVDKSYRNLTSAVDQYIEADPDVKRAKLAKKFWDELHPLSRIQSFRPEQYAEALDGDDWNAAEEIVNGLEMWIAEFRKARPRSLRAVKGK